MADSLSPDIEAHLRNERTAAHLATCEDGDPVVAPVWYRYDGDGTIEIVTGGRKLESIRKNPRVAISVQREENGLPEWAVTLRGTATVIDDDADFTEANRRINEKYGVEPDAWEENTLVRIEVGSASLTEW